MNDPISDNDLQAYADNRLEPARAMQVETWLGLHPEHRARVEEWRTVSAQLHRAYDSILSEPIPQRLIPAANPSSGFAWRRLAAVGWLALGAVSGYWWRGGPQASPDPMAAAHGLPQMASVAHAVYTPEIRHPVEVGADQEAHLVAWLSKRLKAPLHPPNLEIAQFRLVGGRLLPGQAGEVAQFMYENAAQQRLTLYVQPQATESAPTAFHHAHRAGIDTFYWTDRRFGYALSGQLGRNDLLQLATLVYQQLQPPDKADAKPQG
jgi:anti-sigma factor RsiW